MSEDWTCIKNQIDPRGDTGDAGSSIDGVTSIANSRVPLLTWAGAPMRPSELVIHVGPASTATPAQREDLYREEISILVQWDVARAHFETEVDLRGDACWVMTASGVRLFVVNRETDMEPVPVAAAITQRAGASTPGGQPRRSQRAIVPNGGSDEITLPRFCESAVVLPITAGTYDIEILALDGGNNTIGRATRASADVAAPLLLPAGTRTLNLSTSLAGDAELMVIGLITI